MNAKTILITAGTVYGRLDDNKLVGNRIRGIWATKFAAHLFSTARRWDQQATRLVLLLLPDTFNKQALLEELVEVTDPNDRAAVVKVAREGGTLYSKRDGPDLEIRYQSGFDDYEKQCYALAPEVDAAVMAAAVVNWIPETPFVGKMPTEGFEEGTTQNVTFRLAPRVIDRMRKLNPNINLVGCKMTSGAKPEETFLAAYKALRKSRANVVIANDLKNLKQKTLVWPDGSSQPMGDWEDLYDSLENALHDRFYQSRSREKSEGYTRDDINEAQRIFDALVAKYQSRFTKSPDGNLLFGSFAVRCGHIALMTAREKEVGYATRAVRVLNVDRDLREVSVVGSDKATLNAPLLWRMLQRYPDKKAVVHLHEERSGWFSAPYGPPGSVRDNDRDIPDHRFNILGHGCVFTEDL